MHHKYYNNLFITLKYQVVHIFRLKIYIIAETEASDTVEWENQKLYLALRKRGLNVRPILPATKPIYAKKFALVLKKKSVEKKSVIKNL